MEEKIIKIAQRYEQFDVYVNLIKNYKKNNDVFILAKPKVCAKVLEGVFKLGEAAYEAGKIKNENLENYQEARCLVKVEDSLCLLNAEELQAVIDDKIEELVDWLDNE